jgi:alpha-amylase
MGKISKAIKLKLQELRIDSIFKEKISKYTDLLSNDESNNIQEEKKSKDCSDGKSNLNEENILEENKKVDYSKNDKEEINEDNQDNYEIENKEQWNIKNNNYNKTMMQYFEWYYQSDGSLWNQIKENVKELSNVGITALWLPPACKGTQGIYDVGYGIYDLYDLGEFDQKGTVRTKYGTKDEYLEAIEEAHKNNIKIYGDVVFNHKAGADESEIVIARPVADNNRNEFIGEKREIRAHTVFNFPGRGNKYSKYKWTAQDFDGVDFDDITKEHGIFKFEGKEWEKDVDLENGNYDFLMFADLDMDSPYVVDELKRWGKWYLNQTNVDGFRLDAIKHIKFDFFYEWLEDMRKNSEKEVFAVGEYWTHDVNKLKYYIEKSKNCMNLFDVPLHFNFCHASNSFGLFDMRNLADNTLLKMNSDKAVTFVDNHDTQLGQSLESWVQPWFKLLAYTFILTRKEGYPCVFYGDYYGIPEQNFHGLKDKLDIILRVRKKYAYGIQHDYIDDNSIIGWTREGDNEHENSGLASIITVSNGGTKRMYVGQRHKGETWIDITDRSKEKVIIDNDGFGFFSVSDGSYAIWIKDR